MKPRQFKMNFAELLDSITIDQIKEVLLPRKQAKKYAAELRRLEHAIDLAISTKKIKLSAEFIRMVILLAELNLHVWHCKDKMKNAPGKYMKLLKFAQELNGMRNHIKNLMLEEAQEATGATKRATFLNYKGNAWYAVILKDLKGKKTNKDGNVKAGP